jgi:predicted nucleotidyltransferase
VFIEYDRTKKFTLFELAGIKVLLEDEFAADVHIATRDGLHPLMRPGIEEDAVRIF